MTALLVAPFRTAKWIDLMREDARTLLQIVSVDLTFARAEIRLLGLQSEAIDRIAFHIDNATECLKMLEQQSEDMPEKRGKLE